MIHTILDEPMDSDQWWRNAMTEADHDDLVKRFEIVEDEVTWEQIVGSDDDDDIDDDEFDEDEDDEELWEQYLEWKEYNRGDDQ